jgi:catechol 2,3-dioxygenase-like lactoylglutathione lyase family enzyme
MAAFGAVLSVRDIARASRFYQKVLGFEQRFTLPRADGGLTLAVLGLGTTTLLLGRLDELHYENAVRAGRIRRGPHGLGITLTLLVEDLAKAYKAAKKARAGILLKPIDEFYGDRDVGRHGRKRAPPFDQFLRRRGRACSGRSYGVENIQSTGFHGRRHEDPDPTHVAGYPGALAQVRAANRRDPEPQ